METKAVIAVGMEEERAYIKTCWHADTRLGMLSEGKGKERMRLKIRSKKNKEKIKKRNGVLPEIESGTSRILHCCRVSPKRESYH